MYGPESIGHWSGVKAPNATDQHQFLFAGSRYRVQREFTDHDDHVHAAGEEWTFLGCAFLPHEDGLSWFVSLDGAREWHIPMQWRPDEQGEVLDHLNLYVQPA